jgi:hypothetical protein
MKQFIVPANGEALQRAIKALLGQEVLQQVNSVYVAIDEAMNFAWNEAVKVTEAAHKEATEDTASENEAQMAFVFDLGKDQGVRETLERITESEQEAFDDGYVDGVQDARSQPDVADDYIEYLIELDEAEAFEAEYPAVFDAANVVDSGDEDDNYEDDTHYDEDETEGRTNAQVEGFSFNEVKYLS